MPPQPPSVRTPGRSARRVAALLSAVLVGGALPAAAVQVGTAPVPVRSAYVPCSRDFTDVPPSATFYRAVTWMGCTGLTTGYPDGSFGRTRPTSRGESAVFLYRMSGQTHRLGSERPFADVSLGSYAATAIDWMRQQGHAHGYADGTFGIDREITRGELAQLLYRTSGEDSHQPPAQSPFPDVPTTASGYEAVTWLRSTGMVHGYTDGTFGYGAPITRGETAQFLYALETHLHGEPAPPVIPPQPAPEPEPTPADPRYVVIENDLNLRSGPGVSHGILTVLRRDARVTGTGVTRDGWIQITSGSVTGWVNGSYLMEDFEAGTVKSSWSARARAVRPTPRAGVATVQARWVEQPNGWWCGPASLSIALSAFGLEASLEEMARQANTASNGTWLHEVGRVLDLHAPAGVRYSVTTIPGADATAAQRRLFRQDMQRSIAAGVPAVVNLAADPAEQPRHYPRGATVYHHFVVVGYDEHAHEVLVYDPWNYAGVGRFWISADRVADMAGRRGYVSLR